MDKVISNGHFTIGANFLYSSSVVLKFGPKRDKVLKIQEWLAQKKIKNFYSNTSINSSLYKTILMTK